MSVNLDHAPGSSFRLIFNQVLTSICVALSLATLIPLFSIVYFIVSRGTGHFFIPTAPYFNYHVFTDLPPAGDEQTGGIGNAVMGTALMVVIALAMAAPLGILSAIYTAEYEPTGQITKWMRFSANLLTGIPSIICGVFAYAVFVVHMHTYSALAGGVALGLLALPTIFVTAEHAFQGVPRAFREASYGLGATRFQTIFRAILPEAVPAIMTGLMLALARAAGETAPLICTANTSAFYSHDPLKPIASLAILINTFAPSQYSYQRDMAWLASLVLITLVTVANVTAQLAFAKRR